MYVRKVALIALAALAMTGCEEFYDSFTSNYYTTFGFHYRDYDDRLPEASEAWFNSCLEPMTLSHEMTELDLTGRCENTNFGALFEYLEGPFELDTALDLSMGGDSIDTTYGVTTRWFQATCDVRLTPYLDTEEVQLHDLQARWTERDGKPALALDFDFNADIHSELSYTYTVSCPFGAAASVATSALSPFFGPTYEVTLNDADLDIYVVFDEVNGELISSVEVDFSFSEFDTGSVLDALPTTIRDDLLASNNFDADAQGAAIAAAVEASFQGLGDYIPDDVPQGHQVCSVRYYNGGMRLSTHSTCEPPQIIITPPYWSGGWW